MPRDLPWRKWMPWFVGIFCVMLLIALILPAIQQAREAARRTQSKDHLHNLGLAFHNYHDVHQVFPPGSIISEDGTAMHGWESSILPFLDASPTFYYIDFNYPWDDPFNRHVFRIRYDALLNPVLKNDMTEEGFFLNNYSANSALFHRNSSVSFEDLDAGQANVWMTSELFDDWQPWGAPYYWHDLEWPVKVAEGEDGWGLGGAHLLMADGSVQYFGVEPDQLKLIEEIREASPSVPAERKKREVQKWTYLPPGSASPRAYDDTVLITSIRGNYVPDRTPEQVRKDLIRSVNSQFEDNPSARIFKAEPLDLDEETLPLVLQFEQLECLAVAKIVLPEDGLQRLAELKSLTILDATVSQATADRLRELLPDCELRLTIVEPETDEPGVEEPPDARE